MIGSVLDGNITRTVLICSPQPATFLTAGSRIFESLPVTRIDTTLDCYEKRLNIMPDSDATWPSSSLMAVSTEGQVKSSFQV